MIEVNSTQIVLLAAIAHATIPTVLIPDITPIIRYKQILKEALEKVKRVQPELDVSTKLLEGPIAETVLKVAKEEKFDLIVIGCCFSSRFKEYFHRSVSHKVLDRSECPILLVK